MLSIELIQALRDNYIYYIEDKKTGQSAVVDPSEAKPVKDFLESKSKPLHYILNTHHHWDHTGGNLKLKETYSCKVVGAALDEKRIPGIDIALKENEVFKLGKSAAKIIEIPGHTSGHIAFWFKDDKTVFCGDSLFSIGCGRLFEGTPQQMFASLEKLKKLPDETKVYCGHEYTLDNIQFAKGLNKNVKDLLQYEVEVKALRDRNQPSIPSLLKLEKRLNPFLLAQSPEEFAQIRSQKDRF